MPTASVGTNPLGELAEARAFLDTERAAIRQRHEAGLDGTEAVRAISAMTDEIVTRAFERRFGPLGEDAPKLSVVALGGYGRRELAPHSDIDLLFLHEGEPGDDQESHAPEGVREVIEGILYHLWDLGFDVGQATRTLEECVSLARSDQTIQTAMTEARLVAGDAALLGEVMGALKTQLSSPSVLKGFVAAKLKEATDRHKRYGDSVYYLEPHVKNGLGGLRDLQTALWMTRVRFGTRETGDLLQMGVINPRELRELRAARSFLHRVRVALHYRAGRKNDLLTFLDQEAVAPALGFSGGRYEAPSEDFMRAYYQAATTIQVHARHLIERATSKPALWQGTAGGPSHTRLDSEFSVFEGALVAARADIFEKRPAALAEVFAIAGRGNFQISTWTKDRILAGQEAYGPQLARDPKAAAAFLEVLAEQNNDELLDQMHDLGVIGHVLPEFHTVHCQKQRDSYHVYTVDIHSLRSAKTARSLLRGERREEVPRLDAAMRDVIWDASRRRVFLMGVLMHDVGKGKGGRHAEKGARMCRRVGPRLGLAAEETRDVVWLVRWHLEMSTIAQRRDLDDPALIAKFARLCRNPVRLTMLYLLTWADMSSTGPKVWTGWKAELLHVLYRRTLEHLLARDGGEGISLEQRTDAAKRRVAQVLGVREGVGPEEVQAFIERLPDRYFQLVTDIRIRRHFRMLASLERKERDVELQVTGYPKKGYTVVTVVCEDRSGLLALLTGAMAAADLDILSAEILSTKDGKAIDVFRVAPFRAMGEGGHLAGELEALGELDERQVDDRAAVQRPSRQEADALVRRNLIALLVPLLRGDGDIASEVEASKRRWEYSMGRSSPPVEPRVVFDEHASDDDLVFDVFARDRIGLLYDITSAIYRRGFDIALSRVHTEGNRAVDAFYIRDARHQPGAREALQAAVLEAIGSVH